MPRGHAAAHRLDRQHGPGKSCSMPFHLSDLDRAVDAGVITASTRDQLAAFLARPADAGESGPDAENFRLLTGFNDIFVALACVLLLVAVGALVPPSLVGFAVAAAAWGLAEYFTRARRMALPSIVLLLAFVGGILAGVLMAGGFATTIFVDEPGRADMLPALAGAGAAAMAAAAAHWWRFRVPITLAAGAASLAVAAIALATAALGEAVLLPGMLASGLAIFALAMRYDMADRSRTTRRTDIAFWLHLLAAPLIVHPVFALTGITGATGTAASALVVLAVYLSLTLVALAIDRRALLVSALAYVLYALNGLFAAGGIAAGFGLTALILGGFLVTLSAAWSGLRRPLVQRLPPAWAVRLPVASP